MTIEDRMLERLSRYLDGDLDPAEVEQISARLETDRLLQAELSALRQVRRSLAGLADREHPPAELDILVEPLIQGKPTPLIARPWAKFLATAAVIVLGATVIFEINRREIGPRSDLRSTRREKGPQAVSDSSRSAAAESPHPTTKGERPRGAVDRLLASPEPEVNPLDEESPALEVIGPLQDAENDALQAQPRTEDKADTLRSASAGVDYKTVVPDESGKGLGESSVKQRSEQRLSHDERPDGMELNQSTARAKLYVFMEDETAWQGFDPGIQSESGRYALRVRVEGGVVQEVWPVGRPPAAPSQHLRAGKVILGLKIEGVPDGEYAAEVTVEPYAPQPR